MKYDVFISHSSKDKAVADKLCEYLEQHDIKCWIAPRNVLGGMPYAREIFNGIDESQILLLVFSGNSNVSRHVEREIDRAFNKEKVIIPFRIEECFMSDVLSYYMGVNHYIDGIPVPDKAFESLRESIEANLPEHRVGRDRDEAIALLSHELGISMDDLKNALSKMSGHDDEVKTEDNDNDVDGDCSSDKPMSNEVGKKGRYSVLQNAKGDIMITMNAREGEPDNPRLIYDGEDIALLYRSAESSVAFKQIDPGARAPLLSIAEILIVEELNDDVVREYIVPVRIVKDINSLILPSEEQVRAERQIKETWDKNRMLHQFWFDVYTHGEEQALLHKRKNCKLYSDGNQALGFHFDTDIINGMPENPRLLYDDTNAALYNRGYEDQIILYRISVSEYATEDMDFVFVQERDKDNNLLNYIAKLVKTDDVQRYIDSMDNLKENSENEPAKPTLDDKLEGEEEREYISEKEDKLNNMVDKLISAIFPANESDNM